MKLSIGISYLEVRMFRLIKLIVFCGFCYSAYTAWQHKEEILSQGLSYILSQPVKIRGISVDWDGVHFETFEINPHRSHLPDLSLKAHQCTIQLSVWDFLKRPIPLYKVSIKNLFLTQHTSLIRADTLFPNLAIKELHVEKCHIEELDQKGKIKKTQDVNQCTFYNLGKENPLDFSTPAWVAQAPDINPKITKPRRPRRSPPSRIRSTGCFHGVY
jgi:hypothetical protein